MMLQQVDSAQRPQQAEDVPTLLSHDEAFSQQQQSRSNLKGGNQQCAHASSEPAAEATTRSQTDLPEVNVSSARPKLPTKQFWLPWSLWHT